MQTLRKDTYTKPLPKSAVIKTVRGKLVAEWNGKGGKLRKAPIETKADGSQVVRLERSIWLAKYRDENSIVVQRSTGCRNKDAAKVKLAEFIREVERIRAGVMTKEETDLADSLHAHLADVLETYCEYMTGKGNAHSRIETTKHYLLSDGKACGFKVLKDLKPDRLRRHLDSIPGEQCGPATLNQHVKAWVAFGNWLAGKRIRNKRANWNGQKRLAKNPFDGFGTYDEKSDVRRDRRALSETELVKLLTVAADRPLSDARMVRLGPNKGKPIADVKPKTEERLRRLGRERALIYKTMVLTGLRKGELASVTVGQCRLDGDRPYIDLNAGDEKNGQGNDIPLRRDLAAELRAWIADCSARPTNVLKLPGVEPDVADADRKLFTVPTGLVRILNRDLAEAGIPKVDERGYSVDVHALRHSFGTLLSTSGVAPRVAQSAMRHSKMDLTMNVYTDPRLLDVHGAIESLPTLQPAEQETGQATGTDHSQVVGSVGLVGHFPPSLSKVSVVKQELEAENGPRLVRPNVRPKDRPEETIQVDSRGLGDFPGESQKREKPREKPCFSELLSVGLTGFEPATSTPPVPVVGFSF